MRTRLLPVVLALAYATGACSGDGSAATTTGPSSTTTTVPPTTSTAPTTTIAPTTTTPEPSTTSTTPTTTVPPEGPLDDVEPIPEEALPANVPPILVTAGQSVRVLGGLSLLGSPGDDVAGYGVAMDDGAGGLVASVFIDTLGVIRHHAAGNDAATDVVMEPGLILHDVIPGDDPHAVVTRENLAAQQAGSAEREEWAGLIDLTTGVGSDLAQVGGLEWGAISVTATAGLLAVVEVNDGCGELYYLDPVTGDRATGAVPPEPPCEVHFEVPYVAAALDETGSEIAYIAQEWRFDETLGYPVPVASDLVVGDVTTGSELLRIPIAGPGDEYRGIDFDGRWVVATGWQIDEGEITGVLPVLLFDTIVGEAIRVDAPDVVAARFLTSTPAIEIDG